MIGDVTSTTNMNHQQSSIQHIKLRVQPTWTTNNHQYSTRTGSFAYARRRLVAGRDAILRVGNAGTGGVAVASKTRGGFVDWQCFPAPGFGPKTSFATGGWGVQVRLKKMNHSFKMNHCFQKINS
jgi:hypothetical protein